MSSIRVSWEDCEPTVENAWHNITSIDPLMKLDMMSMAIQAYYCVSEPKTPKELEKELRKRKLNVGLIAVEWKKDPYYRKIIEQGKGVILKRRYMKIYETKKKIKLGTIKPQHIGKYVTFVSCKPRKEVIKETLVHSKSIRENLKKLGESGFFVAFSINELLNRKVQLPLPKDDLYADIQCGLKKIKLDIVDLDEIFDESSKKYPDAKLELHKLMSDGSPVFSLVDDNGDLLCSVGVNMYYQGNKKMMSYVSL